MITLAFAHIKNDPFVWVGVWMVAAACGVIGGWAALILVSSGALQGDGRVWLANAGSAIAMTSAVAGVPVASSVSFLAVSSRRKDYALWQLVGVSDLCIFFTVVIVLAAVAFFGAMTGSIVALGLHAPVFDLFEFPNVEIEGVPLYSVAGSCICVGLVIALLFVLGGVRVAFAIRRIAPLEALKESAALQPSRKAFVTVRALLLLLVAATLVAGSFFAREGEMEFLIVWAIVVPFLVAVLFSLAARLLLPALLAVWGILIGKLGGALVRFSYLMARNGLSESVTVESPIALCVGLVAGLFSVVGVLEGYLPSIGVAHVTGLDSRQAILMLGGPALICAVGAAASLIMSTRQRGGEISLLLVEGVSEWVLAALAALEALIHVANATFAGCLVALLSGCLTAWMCRASVLCVSLPLETLVISVASLGVICLVSLVGTVKVLRDNPMRLLPALR